MLNVRGSVIFFGREGWKIGGNWNVKWLYRYLSKLVWLVIYLFLLWVMLDFEVWIISFFKINWNVCYNYYKEK